MEQKAKTKKGMSSFPPLFWLVVIFEFFERGAYYGMMSILSVYLTEHLHFAKESVGIIKGTIQPLLYFLPIISGALADRFGYRKMLMIAFSLLGLGYFLTAQATSYALVFGALVVMGFGAGAFKPIISGSIARVTDESNSTLGFGIYYWSINLGAFLFPLILVPILKKMDWSFVMIASAICTAGMLIPTLLFYKDPVKKQENDKARQADLIQTLANAFEIIYSPVVLLYNAMRSSNAKRIVISVVLLGVFGYSLMNYLETPVTSEKYPKIGVNINGTTLIFEVDRDMLAPDEFQLALLAEDSSKIGLTIYKPTNLENFAPQLLDSIHQYPALANLIDDDIQNLITQSEKKVELSILYSDDIHQNFQVLEDAKDAFKIVLKKSGVFTQYESDLYAQIGQYPILSGIDRANLTDLYDQSKGRSFFILYVIGVILVALGIIFYSQRKNDKTKDKAANYSVPFFVVTALGLVLWFLPGLTLLGKIVSYVIFITVTSLFIIDKSDPLKFKDHAKFLLMIFLYSGFWILYFQMFDSVLWYVQAYVDAASLNSAVNKFLGTFGININWFFDVEHVTVINAGTIILLQLLISNIVKNTKALPTMISGILVGTIGMAILAVSTSIWIFVLGIFLFSIGEMTAHPKFISYIGLIAPTDRKAMYMGYLFLYGVFGSSIGGIMGAKLYVHFVDNLNQPKTLWLIFSLIGVATILALLLYNRFLAPKEPSRSTAS